MFKLSVRKNLNIIAIYRSETVPVQQLCDALQQILHLESSSCYNILIGDFNINWFDMSDRSPLYNLLVRDYKYQQLVKHFTTDYRTCIDHVYTNLPEGKAVAHVKAAYFSDHKPVLVMLQDC